VRAQSKKGTPTPTTRKTAGLGGYRKKHQKRENPGTANKEVFTKSYDDRGRRVNREGTVKDCFSDATSKAGGVGIVKKRKGKKTDEKASRQKRLERGTRRKTGRHPEGGGTREDTQPLHNTAEGPKPLRIDVRARGAPGGDQKLCGRAVTGTFGI